ncbi:hypothetical protein MRX96_000242 [Rhipicephalus microplus]
MSCDSDSPKQSQDVDLVMKLQSVGPLVRSTPCRAGLTTDVSSQNFRGNLIETQAQSRDAAQETTRIVGLNAVAQAVESLREDIAVPEPVGCGSLNSERELVLR